MEQLAQLREPEPSHGLDVAVGDAVQHGGVVGNFRDAGFAEEVQHRERRAVGVVLDRVRNRASELILRMEGSDLDDADQFEVLNEQVGAAQKIVVVVELIQDVGMNQDRRFDSGTRCGSEVEQFPPEGNEQLAFIRSFGYRVANESAIEDAPGDWAEVQADHDVRDPLLRLLNDEFRVHASQGKVQLQVEKG